jgi:protein-L-isoaspartate(D-aspartate) O-methyltransferase
MTGEAEAKRAVLPNPLQPQIANGSFEELVESRQPTPGSHRSTPEPRPAEPAGWHYLRQVELKSDGSAPDGKRFAMFKNDEPGRPSQALQGFAIDGRKIGKLQLSYSVRGQNISSGQSPTDWPFITITFYDDRRAAIDDVQFGPFAGTFDWHTEQHIFSVPLKAREAIIRFGLEGAVGELAIDDLQLQVQE